VIRRCVFARALRLVHRSRVDTELELLLRPPGRGGQPRRLRIDVFLAALLCTIGTKPNLTLTHVYAVLTQGLARSYQMQLGVRRGGEALSIHNLRYLLSAIEKKLSYTGDRATKQVRVDGCWQTVPLSAAERADREALLQAIMDKLLAATVPAHLPRHGHFAIDASGIESAARGKRRPGDVSTPEPLDDPDEPRQGAVAAAEVFGIVKEVGYSFDPDARWGYRTRTYDNRTQFVFGYHLLALARIQPVGWRDAEPLLTERITLVAADADLIGPSLGIIDRLAAEKEAVLELACDRGFSYAVAERWADQLRARDIDQVLDLHKNDHGVRDFEGTLIIAGLPHCPRTPEHLRDIRRPAQLSVGALKKSATAGEKVEHAEKVAELADFQTAIAEREKYSFRRVAGPDQTGKERYQCPAFAGKLRCDRCPFSLGFPDTVPRAEETPGTEAPVDANDALDLDQLPRGCRQQTITVPGDVTPKVRQRLRWGSPEWIASYIRRTLVEGVFGNLKNPRTENVRRGWIHVVGIVKTSLMIVIAQAAANLRLLRAWADRTGDHTDELTKPDPPSHGHEELEAGDDAGGLDPPRLI
jgi:hypothetical protein